MAYSPISFIASNYRDYKNEWLKAYEPGTTTPKAMATDSSGSTTIAKAQLNADGFIVSASAALIIPYINGSYDLWLFPTEVEADNNDTSSALRLADNINSLNISIINDLSQTYEFPTVAAYKAFATAFPIGKVINTVEFSTGNGGGASYTIIASGTENGFDIIKNTTLSQSIFMTVENGTVSTAQLGTTKIASDYLALQYACNNANWNTIIIESYSPIGGYAYLNRSNVIFDGKNRLIDYVGVSNAMLVLGEQAGGIPSTASILNIDIRNIYAIGDKTAGSRIVFYRKASTCTHHNWRVSSLATPFNGDGEVAVGYESLACKFYDMDFRNNTIGFDDSVGSFQASTFYGGRIEANDFEGVRTKTTNLDFNGTVIEGNDVLLTGVSQVLADGGGSLQFSKCYMELKAASPNQAFITVAAGSTKRISIIGGDYYGQNTGPETALLVSGADWTLGGLTVIGAQLNQVNRICDRAGAVGNWHGSFDYWANIALQDPSLTINGANFYDSNRVDGVTTDRFTALTRMTTPDLQFNQAGSAGIAHNVQRFIGRISASGVGVWHDVIDLDDLGGAASTSLSIELKFLSRAADFYFNVNLIISGTTTIAFTDLGDNNYASSSFQIVGGILQVDNLPPSNRDWNCRITSVKSALS